jgi:hypothetical protein
MAAAAGTSDRAQALKALTHLMPIWMKVKTTVE